MRKASLSKNDTAMQLLIKTLEERICRSLSAATGVDGFAAIVRPATDPRFGDYQANGVMAAAKKLKTNPRELAQKVVQNLDVSGICKPPEIAGPGFINLRLKPNFIAQRLLAIAGNSRLAIDKADKPKTVVVDFSGPNIAKQMHVGHLRSTIIGDCICRIFQFQGHKVIPQNHIGDWGTQFGILIAYQAFKNLPAAFGINGNNSIEDLEKYYKAAQDLFQSNPEFAKKGRDYVVHFQSGNEEAMKSWNEIVELSRNEIYPIYKKLGITLTRENEKGESFYRDMLAGVVGELKKAGHAVESDGAVCVFPPGFKNKEGQPLPLIIRKADGAFLYATTDLAALKYRVQELGVDEIVYVTDARQSLHFQMVFKVARMAGWVPEHVKLVHVTFGSVLGEDGKPLKTREGENVKLKELLDEAVRRAETIVEQKNSGLPKEKKRQIAQAVGTGAVKYADYSNNRTSDYIFSFDKMLAMDGNTAPYMQYAYARIKSIERKAASKEVDVETELAAISTLNLTEPDELNLAKQLLQYGEAIHGAAADYKPNYLTSYLYELSQKFSGFYTNCPVLHAGKDKRPTRLLLCDLTAETIKHGLSQLLGIKVVEKM